MADIVERALAATRESRRIAIRSDADTSSLVRDLAAMANSGGGAIVLRGQSPERVLDEFRRETDSEFADVHVDRGVIVVGEAITPVVIDGIMYIRRGARTGTATTADVANLIDRRFTMVRKAWLSAVKQVVQPGMAAAAAVRVVTDPRAPAFRLVDYDKTHPFRQKEVLAALRERLPEMRLTQFDLLAIRKVHGVDANADFVHKPAFGSNQYSMRFVDWLRREIERDGAFISAARDRYIKTRRP